MNKELASIVKIINRATSDAPAEAESALSAALARMRRAHLSIEDILTQVPADEIFQSALVDLAKRYCREQDISEPAKRDLFHNLLEKILSKYGSSVGTDHGARDAALRQREAELRRREQEFAQERARHAADGRNATDSSETSSATQSFSFLPAKFWSGIGNPFLRDALRHPIMTGRLFLVSLVWGGFFGAVAVLTVAILHAFFKISPVNISVPVTYGIFAFPLMVWKSLALYRAGWYRRFS